MEYKLTELIEQKTFKELSEMEKRFVLEHISEEEYREKSELISKVKKELTSEGQKLKAPEHIRTSALEALRSKHEEKSARSIPLFFQYEVPLWTSIAAILLVFILTTPFIFNNGITEVKTTEQLTMTDTIYVEKIVNDTIEVIQPADTIVKTVYRSVPSNSAVNNDLTNPVFSNENNSLIHKEFNSFSAYEDYTNPIDLNTPSSGKSLSNDPLGKIVLGVAER